jgi:hypothetical protein
MLTFRITTDQGDQSADEKPPHPGLLVKHSLASLGGGIALAIDAKSERAAAWYTRFGAVRLVDDPLKLVLPFAVVADAAKRASHT